MWVREKNQRALFGFGKNI